MSSSIQSVALASVFSLAFLSQPLTALANETPPPHIAVTGEGEMAIAPDMAVLGLAVASEEQTAREALDANNEAMAAVLAAMKGMGIADRDLQTSGFSITPRYVYPKRSTDGEAPRIVGYQVNNSLTVRVRDLSKLGEIIDRSVSLGVNQGGNITFTNDDPSAAITEARKNAMADAIARATTLTGAAGVELGNILSITEQSFRPQPMPVARAEMAMSRDSGAVPVASGENTYRIQVNVTFALTQ